MKATYPGTTALPPCPDSTHPDPEPEAVSAKEARRQMGNIGNTKFYELIRDGVLPTIKLGRRRLVRPSTIRRVLASLESTGTEPSESAASRDSSHGVGEPTEASQ